MTVGVGYRKVDIAGKRDTLGECKLRKDNAGVLSVMKEGLVCGLVRQESTKTKSGVVVAPVDTQKTRLARR